jgi:hypothetical protein
MQGGLGMKKISPDQELVEQSDGWSGLALPPMSHGGVQTQPPVGPECKANPPDTPLKKDEFP